MSRQGLLIAWVLSVIAAATLGAFLGRPTNAVVPSHPEPRDGREDALEPMMASILARLEGIEERLRAVETREHRSPTPDTSATPTDGETGPLEDLIDRMKELAADLERANRAAAVLEEAHKLRRDIPTRWPEVARFLGLPKRQRTAEALMLPVSALVTRFGAPTRVRSYPAGWNIVGDELELYDDEGLLRMRLQGR